MDETYSRIKSLVGPIDMMTASHGAVTVKVTVIDRNSEDDKLREREQNQTMPTKFNSSNTFLIKNRWGRDQEKKDNIL
jgi:hypothetical protein